MKLSDITENDLKCFAQLLATLKIALVPMDLREEDQAAIRETKAWVGSLTPAFEEARIAFISKKKPVLKLAKAKKKK